MEFDAAFLAPAWLSVAVASSKDGARPALDRTVCLEQFEAGMRITATDSYLLLTAWVPALDCEFDEPPELDERPVATAVAIDRHGRARGLLGHALGLVAEAAKAKTGERFVMQVRLGWVDAVDVDDRVSFAGMDPSFVVLELPDRERVKLRVFEGEFPSWRSILTGFKAKRTGAIALSPERVEQLAHLAKRQAATDPIRFELGGTSKGVRVSVANTTIEGIVMPVRWDFDIDGPRDDEAPNSDGETADG